MATTRNVGRGGGHSPANVTKHLKGIDFPASKQDLVKQAKQANAGKEVLDEIQRLDEKEYGSMADVMKSFGKGHATSPGSSQASSKSGSSQTASRSKSSSRSTSHGKGKHA